MNKFNLDRAQNICERYPDYRFNISGIGELPSGSDEKLGKCSQMACFVRLDVLHNHLNTDESIDQLQRDTDISIFPIEKFPYKLLFNKAFPINQDARSVEVKIMDDVKYFIHRHLSADDPYFNEEKDLCEIPLENILPFVHDTTDLNELRSILHKEFVINETDCIEHKLAENSDFEQSDDGDNYENQQHVELHQHSSDDESWD